MDWIITIILILGLLAVIIVPALDYFSVLRGSPMTQDELDMLRDQHGL